VDTGTGTWMAVGAIDANNATTAIKPSAKLATGCLRRYDTRGGRRTVGGAVGSVGLSGGRAGEVIAFAGESSTSAALGNVTLRTPAI
jgi:hypothetical protein